MLLLFTHCEAITEQEPNQVTYVTPKAPNSMVSSMHTITKMDGTITQVECSQETLPSGEIIQICIPAKWNGELILYAHGYVPEFEPLRLPDQADVYKNLFTSVGFAFATTSYAHNGLDIQSGIADMLNLRSLFIQQFGEPKEIYLTGASQGGIITTLAIERYPQLFSGGLALCSPCGSFQGQINYYGNFRVLFDYFFPGILPGDAVNIPDVLFQNWETVYVPAVLEAINKNPRAALKLLRTAQAPYEPSNPSTIDSTVIDVLTYDVKYMNNAKQILGGQPFDNSKKVYFGTGNILEDARLNLRVQRFSADPTALQNIQENYETTGKLSIPLVGMQTTKDPIQLIWHLPLYQEKTSRQGNSEKFIPIMIPRYGHCTFTEVEVISSFAMLILKVKGQNQPLLARSSDATGRVIRSVTIHE